MRKAVLISSCVFAIASCGPNVPSHLVKESGIIASSRNKNEVTILYQRSSTTKEQLQAEAKRVCGKIGKGTGSSRDAALLGASRIPGVDGKVIFKCV